MKQRESTTAVMRGQGLKGQPCQELVKYEPLRFHDTAQHGNGPVSKMTPTTRGREFAGYKWEDKIEKKESERKNGVLEDEMTEEALKLKEAEIAEKARAEKMRKRKEVEKILEEEDELPWGVSYKVVRICYAVFAFWGLVVGWKDKVRRRVLSREMDRSDDEDRVLRHMKTVSLEKQQYEAGTVEYLHIRSIVRHFRNISDAYEELEDKKFRVHQVGEYYGKKGDALIRILNLESKLAPVKESLNADRTGHRSWSAKINEAHGGHQVHNVLVNADMNIVYKDTATAIRTQELSDKITANLSLAREQEPKHFRRRLKFIDNAYVNALALHANFLQHEKAAWVQKFGIECNEDFLKFMEGDAKQVESRMKERELLMKNLGDIEKTEATVAATRERFLYLIIAIICSLIGFKKLW